MFGRGNISEKRRGYLSIPDNRPVISETKFSVPFGDRQLTESFGSLAAFLIGQTCSSCCWTERHYWFSTQRTPRLHRCPMTWPTGYPSPVGLCLNAAKRTTIHAEYILTLYHRTKHFLGLLNCTEKNTVISNQMWSMNFNMNSKKWRKSRVLPLAF